MRLKPKTPEKAFEEFVRWTRAKLERFKQEKYAERLVILHEHKDEFIQVFREVFATWEAR